MPSLPTLHTYPGLELAGLEETGELGAAGGIAARLKKEAEAYAAGKFETEVAPRIREEAAKGAEAAVKPLFLAAVVLAGTSLIFSIAALFRASRR